MTNWPSQHIKYYFYELSKESKKARRINQKKMPFSTKQQEQGGKKLTAPKKKRP